MDRHGLTKSVQSFARNMRNIWQIYFLPPVAIYGFCLLQMFYIAKSPANMPISAAAENINLFLFFLAGILAITVFQLKRIYFSRRFIRRTIESDIAKNPDVENEALLRKVMNLMRKKMQLIWLLGALIICEGILLYWLTGLSLTNSHAYFIIGVYSLLINYPRNDLFADIPWYILQEKKELGLSS